MLQGVMLGRYPLAFLGFCIAVVLFYTLGIRASIDTFRLLVVKVLSCWRQDRIAENEQARATHEKQWEQTMLVASGQMF